MKINTPTYEDQLSPYSEIVQANAHGNLGFYEECLSDAVLGWVITAVETVYQDDNGRTRYELTPALRYPSTTGKVVSLCYLESYEAKHTK